MYPFGTGWSHVHVCDYSVTPPPPSSPPPLPPPLLPPLPPLLLPPSPGNNSSGVHEVDVKTLDSGLHLFILNIQDGYGKSVLKLHQFTVGTGMNWCGGPWEQVWGAMGTGVGGHGNRCGGHGNRQSEGTGYLP